MGPQGNSHKAQAFELAFKHRELDSGPEVCRACDSLQQAIRQLYRQADISRGHRTAAGAHSRQRCWPLQATLRPYKPFLAIPDDHSKPYLSVDQLVIRRAFELAL